MLNKPTIIAIFAMAAQQGQANLQDWTEWDTRICNEVLESLEEETNGDLSEDVSWHY